MPSCNAVLCADDVVSVHLPMRIMAEAINDPRPGFEGFHAIMMGPLLMAGLTHDSRVIVADPADVQSLVEPVPTEGSVSSAASAVKCVRNKSRHAAPAAPPGALGSN